MNDWMKVAQLNEIPALGARVIKTATMNVAVFRNSQNQVFALKDECPHKKGPLSQGIVHGTTVTCPLHNWKIQLDSGEAVAPDEGCVRAFDTKVEAGVVYIKAR